MLAGCGGADTPAAAPSPSSAPSPSPSPSKAGPAGAAACKLVGAAIRNGTIMEPGVVDAIVADAADATPFLRAAGTRLRAAYQNAVEAKGKPNEAAFVAAVRQHAGQMTQTCATVNFPTT